MMAFFAVQDDFADKSAHTSASTACAVAAIGATVGESFITFQVSGYNTYGGSINAAGVVDGSYVDLHGMAHGFVRAADGTIISFDPKGSTNTWCWPVFRPAPGVTMSSA